jgi:UDPglucose 6-dehydrogenase
LLPVGTADKVRAAIAEELQARGLETDYSVVSNPEFLKEGAAVEDFMKPDRMVVGVGYGGSCFPKDVQALIRTAADAGQHLQVLHAVEAANEAQKSVLTQKIVARLGENLADKTIALWGLAFKPNTDDMREAPSRVLIADLLARGATIQAFDPVALHEAQRLFGHEPRIRYAATPMAALDGADALAIVTEWKEFRSPDFAAIKACLKTPVIFDGRNLYDPAQMLATGLEYFSVGRGQVLR